MLLVFCCLQPFKRLLQTCENIVAVFDAAGMANVKDGNQGSRLPGESNQRADEKVYR